MTKHEKEGQIGEECEWKKCVCGLEICLGGAEVEIGGVCHRIGNPCYIIEPKISEEKKDWEEEYRKRIKASGWYGHLQTLGHRSLEEFIGSDIMFIEALLEEEREAGYKEGLKESIETMSKGEDKWATLIYCIREDGVNAEREKWRLKNAGLYRQLFGENKGVYTSKELWKIFDSYYPLFTEDQKKELKDNLNSIMK